MDSTLCTYHPLLLELVRRLESLGVGTVMQTPDGHLFFQPCVAITSLRGAVDLKQEGAAAGVRIVIRKVSKRSKYCKYAKMPWYQLYTLPIPVKNAATMTDAERRNSDIYRQALRLAHAVLRDPEQAAFWRQKHEAHRVNPRGYSKQYPNFFGFLVATFRMQLAAQQSTQKAAQPAPQPAALAESPAICESVAPQQCSVCATSGSASITLARISLAAPRLPRISLAVRSKSCASSPPRARSIPLLHPPRRIAA